MFCGELEEKEKAEGRKEGKAFNAVPGSGLINEQTSGSEREGVLAPFRFLEPGASKSVIEQTCMLTQYLFNYLFKKITIKNC